MLQATIFFALFAFSAAVPWDVLSEKVCFTAKENGFGEVDISDHQGFFQGVKIDYLTGGVTCNASYALTHFGCDGKSYYSKQSVSLFVTDGHNNIYFPHWQIHRNGFYKHAGSHANADTLVFTNLANPSFVPKGRKLRVWYGEALVEKHHQNNDGETCVKVSGWFTNLE